MQATGAPGAGAAKDDRMAATAATMAAQEVSRVSGTGARQLRPVDGLYLRAQHLTTIQNYGRQLAYLGGVAGGSGVVFGYRVALTASGKALSVGPGLAVDPMGRPLHNEDAVELALDELDTSTAGRFWLIGVEYSAPIDSGDPEPVYGGACPQPCSGADQHVYTQDSVKIFIRSTDLASFGGTPEDQRRSTLARRYFGTESITARSWLTPNLDPPDPAGSIAPLESRPWADPQPDAAPTGPVHLGAMLRINGDWLVDVWVARRDLEPSHPVAGWMGRLGLRPWNVFVAQILQFQDQLRGPGLTLRSLDELYETLAQPVRESDRPALRKMLINRLGLQWPRSGPVALPDRGFVELPPSGFIPRPAGADGEQLREKFEELFGRRLAVNLRISTADDALRAVTGAQHLDRIPLDGDLDPPPTVDVWVPDVRADLAAKQTGDYGWAAFVRRPAERVAAAGEPADDDVDAYVVQRSGDQPVSDLVQEMPGGLPKGGSTALGFPRRAIGTPTTEDAFAAIHREIGDRAPVAAVGIARAPSRRSTMVGRALALLDPFDKTGQLRPWPIEIFGLVDASLAHEIAVIVVNAAAPDRPGQPADGDEVPRTAEVENQPESGRSGTASKKTQVEFGRSKAKRIGANRKGVNRAGAKGRKSDRRRAGQ